MACGNHGVLDVILLGVLFACACAILFCSGSRHLVSKDGLGVIAKETGAASMVLASTSSALAEPLGTARSLKATSDEEKYGKWLELFPLTPRRKNFCKRGPKRPASPDSNLSSFFAMRIEKTASSKLFEFLSATNISSVAAGSGTGHQESKQRFAKCHAGDALFFFGVRAPLARWISGYYEVWRCCYNNKKYREFLGDPSLMACALGSSNKTLAERAAYLGTHAHTGRLAEHLGDDQHLSSCFSSIAGVYRQEFFNDDWKKIINRWWPKSSKVHNVKRQKALRWLAEHSEEHTRAIKQKQVIKTVNTCAVQNLRPFLQMDYEKIDLLTQCGFLPKGYPEAARQIDAALWDRDE